MCCRYMLLSEHARDLLAKAGVPDEDGDGAYPSDNYNIAPGGRIRGVRGGSGKKHGLRGVKREGVSLLWNFGARVPPLINARAESVWEKPAFREAARERRCLIPASGFYEWEHLGRARLPWLFQLRDAKPFFLAGVWSPGAGADGVDSCAVITTEPNALMRPIHHRMPAIIFAEDTDAWLDGGIAEARGLLAPVSPESMAARRVSSRVNNVRNNDAACMAPDEGGAVERQGEFLL